MARRFSAEPHIPKYQQVIENLARDILTGRYQPGQKFPSEAALVQQFRTSRITVGRALRELTQRGLVERIAGSGTYVRQSRQTSDSLLFGLLIPDLGRTEIFEPICHGIAGSPDSTKHAFLWGSTPQTQASQEQQALQLCDQFIQRGVSGVFFAPLEIGPTVRETNLTIMSRLEEARIPIILFDRCVLPYPYRVRHDLVGIDNRRAGFIAADHLLREGAQKLSMIAYSGAAPTVEARAAGFREALLDHGLPAEPDSVHRLETITEATVRPLLPAKKEQAAFVCANDRTAGHLLHAILALGYRVPQDVRIVGIDDVEYASILPVPLTTVHQPCREIGEAAMAAMLERVKRPNRFVREILVECHLVIRQSCGTKSGIL